MDPPNVANEIINSILPPVAAEPPTRRAGASFKRTRVVEALHNASGGETITEEELGEQVGFQVTTALALNPGILGGGNVPPPWFTIAIAPLIAEFRALNTRVETISTQINTIDIRQRIQEAMFFNAMADNKNDPLRPVPNAAGIAPPAIFPTSLVGVKTLNTNNLNQLLIFYGEIPRQVRVVIKPRRLCKLIGVRSVYTLNLIS